MEGWNTATCQMAPSSLAELEYGYLAPSMPLRVRTGHEACPCESGLANVVLSPHGGLEYGYMQVGPQFTLELEYGLLVPRR
jgi:hypothetical protein